MSETGLTWASEIGLRNLTRVAVLLFERETYGCENPCSPRKHRVCASIALADLGALDPPTSSPQPICPKKGDVERWLSGDTHAGDNHVRCGGRQPTHRRILCVLPTLRHAEGRRYGVRAVLRANQTAMAARQRERIFLTIRELLGSSRKGRAELAKNTMAMWTDVAMMT